MKVSHQLCKQNLGWHFKQLWALRKNLKIRNTGVDKILAEKGISVIKPDDILKEKRKIEKIEVVGFRSKPIVFDNTHPNWHDRVLLTYKDNNVLLEGLTQAKILTNTVELRNDLPNNISLKDTKKIDNRVKEIILTAHAFDAQQKKLPKIKDSERPAWNFPRTYGITQERSIKLLILNLLQLIENISEPNLVKERQLLDDLLFCYNFEKYKNLVQFELKGDSVLTSTKPLSAITTEKTDSFELPDIFPIKPTITLNEENIYELQQVYPIDVKFSKSHPHTVFVHHIETEVQNIYEEEVTEPQIFGRSLLKTFTVAASYAKAKYGSNVKSLPKPVTVQCVQTNGKLFHFGIFQLNTLDLEGTTKNIWYQTGRIPLFDFCGYKVGKPVLEGYNSKVVQYLNAFYHNV